MTPRSCSIMLVLFAAAAAGCATRAPSHSAAPASAASGTGDGPTLSAPAARTNRALRVLVYHDMEGLAGQDDYRTFNYSHPEFYARGQEYLAADINAVVDGLFAGGATSVEIVDAHGSGNPSPDLVPAKLDPRATQLTRDAPFRHYVDIVAPNAYDAIVAVGMHAKTGSVGFASHTVTIGMGLWMNGRSITETEIVAFSWGRVGVPVIFVSGDDHLQRDLVTMPWLQFVVAKSATSANTVRLRNVEAVHAEMRVKAAEAVRGLARAKVMRVQEPVRAALRVVQPASLTMLRGVPGVELSTNGDEVAFTATDFQQAYDGLNALIGVARLAYPTTTNEIIREHGDNVVIGRLQRERLMERWFDVESGRWRPPDPPIARTGRKYYGAQ